MLLPSLLFLASLAGAFQEPAPNPVRIPLGDLNPELVLSVVQRQLGPTAPIALDQGSLLVKGDPDTLESIQTLILQLSLKGQRPFDLLPTPKGDLALAIEGQARSLMNLVDDYVTQTGIRCIVPNPLRDTLARVPIELNGVTALAPAQAVQQLESLLYLNQVGLLVSLEDEQTCLTLTGTGFGAPPNIPFVAQKDLAPYANHPALLICTTLELPTLDIRSLSNTARTLILQPNLQQIIPAGNSNVLVLTGTGSWVHSIALVFQSIETMQRRQIEAARTRSALILEVFQLQFADAVEMSRHISEILDAYPSSASANTKAAHPLVVSPLPPGFRVLVDPRTNAVIVLCVSEVMAQVRELVTKLDIQKG